jgi:hypothetical protein
MALFYLLIKTPRVVHKKVSHFLKFEGFHCDENLECGLLDNDSLIKEVTFFSRNIAPFSNCHKPEYRKNGLIFLLSNTAPQNSFIHEM